MKNKVWQMVKPSLKGSWGWIILSTFLSLALVGANIVQPIIYGSLIDRVSEAVNQSFNPQQALVSVAGLLTMWAGFFLLAFVLSAVTDYVSWYATLNSMKRFSNFLYRIIIRHGVRWHSDHKSGEIIRRFDKASDGLWQIIFSTLQNLIPSLFSFTVVLIIGFFLHWQLTLLALSPIPLALLIGWLGLVKVKPKQKKVNKIWEKIYSYYSDNCSNIISIKTNTAEEASANKLQTSLNDVITKQAVIHKWWSILGAGQHSIDMIARILIFTSGVVFIVNGSLSIGTLITFLGFITYIYTPLNVILGWHIPQMVEGIVGLQRVQKWWETDPEIKEVENPITLKGVKDALRFKNVSFSYKKEEALKNVSFSVPAGSTVALVGESGSGKSTAASLICRLYDPIKGKIMIDDYDLRELSIESLRSNIGYVLQENLLFHDTIINNVRFARPKASKQDIIVACKEAQADDFIMKLPRGYNAVVGERGVKLSGGEKQRIVIARTLLKDPPILVLDEATSALDSKTEYELQKAMAAIMEDRTVVVIAHRLSTIMAADLILVFDKGRIVERGTHKELARSSKIYKNLWNLQAGGYLD
ncbi:MAG: ABC transporter ATP-binding protein [Candidatus Uhrbacteria bacterium]